MSLLAAVFVYRQVREARLLREEQTRPFVIVDVALRRTVIELAVTNIGTTVAQDVIVRFDEPLVSTHSAAPNWTDGPLFTRGMPLMAPGRIIRFFLDTFPQRGEAGLQMLVRGHVSYRGPGRRRKLYDETFEIDLEVYWQSLLSERGMPDLVNQVEQLRKEISKWTDGSTGLQVHASDRNRDRRRELRRLRLHESVEGGRRFGSHVSLTSWVRAWLARSG